MPTRKYYKIVPDYKKRIYWWKISKLQHLVKFKEKDFQEFPYESNPIDPGIKMFESGNVAQ